MNKVIKINFLKHKTPSTLLPTLATLVGSAPTGDDWLHEIRYDGYRLLCRIEKGKARLVSRNGKDWTKEFPQVARAVGQQDGNTAFAEATGRHSDFLHRAAHALQTTIFEVFDRPLVG